MINGKLDHKISHIQRKIDNLLSKDDNNKLIELEQKAASEISRNPNPVLLAQANSLFDKVLSFIPRDRIINDDIPRDEWVLATCKLFQSECIY